MNDDLTVREPKQVSGRRSGAIGRRVAAVAAMGFALAGPVRAQAAGAGTMPVATRFGLMTPMRDGVKLASDMWLPAAPGRYPVILIRTPYLKSMPELQTAGFGRYFASHGYALVVQDVRGRGDSDGEFDFFFQEEQDGYDTIEWLAAQPFSNGRVGMMGVSYLGTVQWLAAKAHPPHLVCMAPTAPAGRYVEELPFEGGAFMHQWALQWINDVSGRISQGPNLAGRDMDAVLAHRPLLTADSALGRPMRLYREFLTHPLMNEYWKRIQFTPDDFRSITIPTLTVTGWFDGDQPGALFYWRGLEQYGTDQGRHWLVAGPWTHVQTFLGGGTKLGDMEFAPSSVIDNKALHLAFFDWCLKQSAPSFDQPKVRVYVPGLEAWQTFDRYPPEAVADRTLYLTSGGHANSLAGDGGLSWEAPGDQPPDRFGFDPKRPVPNSVSDDGAGEDRRPIQRRDDVLVYTSEVLTEPLEIMGNIKVNLQAATDGRDTDFTAALTDVYPDGRAVKLGPVVGIRRGRYRFGPTREVLLEPGKVATFPIELYDIAHRFEAGHRIRIEISSSAAPMFNPNQNTGNPVATDTTWRVARQTVYHDRARASSVTLPVMGKPLTP